MTEMKIPTLEPIHRTYVSDTVTEILENYIVDNNLKEGDKLPSERELSQVLKVGTRTIREALQRLETQGMIEIVHGKGSFVANRNVESYARHLVNSFRFLHTDEQRLLAELNYVRRIIEAAAIEQATTDLRPQTIYELDSVLKQLVAAKDEGDVNHYNDLDLQFHRIIVQSTGNTLLSALYEHLRELLGRTFERTGNISGAMERSIKDHIQIFAAIRSGTPETARKALLEHISRTAEDMRAFLNGRQ